MTMTKRSEVEKDFWKIFSPWIGTIILIPIVVFYTLNGGNFTFIDYINLLIHEGGHGVFIIFGKFIYTLGGTLMQIIIPGMFVFFYLLKKKKFLAQLFLIWLGENLINISVYAADAQVRKLPLLGGNKVYHDWNWILGEIGILEYDYVIGYFFFGLGIIMFILALMIPLFLKEHEHANIVLDI